MLLGIISGPENTRGIIVPLALFGSHVSSRLPRALSCSLHRKGKQVPEEHSWPITNHPSSLWALEEALQGQGSEDGWAGEGFVLLDKYLFPVNSTDSNPFVIKAQNAFHLGAPEARTRVIFGRNV